MLVLPLGLRRLRLMIDGLMKLLFVDVKQSYKGPIVRSLFHPDKSTSCRLEFKTGVETLVFANRSADGLATTSICTMDLRHPYSDIMNFIERQIDKRRLSTNCRYKIGDAKSAQVFTGKWELDDDCASQIDLFEEIYGEK